MTTPTYNNRRPHLIERGYCFAGLALPSDAGEGGTNGENCVCIERVTYRSGVALLEGRGCRRVKDWLRIDERGTCEQARDCRDLEKGLSGIAAYRDHGEAIRSSIAIV